MMITVFTPSYNRTALLKRLFESLRRQTSFNFEWLIVDDGSVEDLRPIVDSFLSELNGEFKILLIRQENSGKHIAINRGVDIARGELFFIVDNDDYLHADAIEKIEEYWKPIMDDPSFGGLCFNKCFESGETLGSPKYTVLDCTPLDFRYSYQEKGDKAEVVRTHLLRDLPFPATPGEKFCPEALFFERLSCKLRYLNVNIYYCAYLPDGLSAKIVEVRKRSPINTCLYYRTLACADIPLLYQLKALINYYRFSTYLPVVSLTAFPAKFLLRLLAWPIGKMMYLKER